MADDNSRDEDAAPEAPDAGDSPASPESPTTALGRDDLAEGSLTEGAETSDGHVVAAFGVERYVHAAFLAAAVVTAYLLGKILQAAWSYLLDWPEAVRQFPTLLEYSEEQRGSLTLLIGAVLGGLLVLRYYRRPFVRNWATGVAGELSRVTWPSKDAVTSGTVVVLVAGAVATFYVAVLDRLWGYLTNLVYGT
jgi:preprotein translocase subunit SecE